MRVWAGITQVMASVHLDSIEKVYDNGQLVVASATFDVADGELLVLVGPSGCGKSTLLRMIAGLEEISGGQLRIGERVVNTVAPKDREVAMVFQNYALYPHMTVAQNLAFGIKLRGLKPALIAERIANTAQMLELTPLLSKYPKALSGGQRQRVALGRAIVRQPSVLLLDEPLSNLDAKLRHSVRTEIARLHRRLQMTMIYVTHDQIEAMTLGQRIVVLHQGEIQQIGPPMELYEAPANLFVASFIGYPTMNLLPGRLVYDQAWVLQLPSGEHMRLHGIMPSPQWHRQDVVVGLRPEHLTLAREGDQVTIMAMLTEVEPIGHEVFLSLAFAQHRLTLRMPPQPIPPLGTQLPLTINAAQAHFFDPDSTRRLVVHSTV